MRKISKKQTLHKLVFNFFHISNLLAFKSQWTKLNKRTIESHIQIFDL